jgi:hypothetical protein
VWLLFAIYIFYPWLHDLQKKGKGVTGKRQRDAPLRNGPMETKTITRVLNTVSWLDYLLAWSDMYDVMGSVGCFDPPKTHTCAS